MNHGQERQFMVTERGAGISLGASFSPDTANDKQMSVSDDTAVYCARLTFLDTRYPCM